MSSYEVGEIRAGQIALGCITDNMANISGMNEEVQKIKEEMGKEKVKEEIENFLKEILG